MAMMGSSRSLPGSASCPRMAANMPFQPFAKLGLPEHAVEIEELPARAAGADCGEQVGRAGLVVVGHVGNSGHRYVLGLGRSSEQRGEQEEGEHESYCRMTRRIRSFSLPHSPRPSQLLVETQSSPEGVMAISRSRPNFCRKYTSCAATLPFSRTIRWMCSAARDATSTLPRSSGMAVPR